MLLIIVCLGGSIALVSFSFAHARFLPFSPLDFENLTITLDHETLHFTNGFYESPDGHHVARLTERHMNQSATRAAAILIDNPAGSGVFFYVIGATRTDGKAKYSAPVFLGDRIQIETINVNKETITLHYLTHSANAPLGTTPTQPAVATYTFLVDGNLSAVS